MPRVKNFRIVEWKYIHEYGVIVGVLKFGIHHEQENWRLKMIDKSIKYKKQDRKGSAFF